MHSLRKWKLAVALLKNNPDMKVDVLAKEIGMDCDTKEEYNAAYHLAKEICAIWKIERKEGK